MKFISNILYNKLYLLLAVLLTTAFIFSSGYSFGQTWDGSESNDWNTGDNWDGGSVPNGDNVTIPAIGVTFMPVISVDPANEIADITIESGATLTQTGGTFILNKLKLEGAFNQSGGTLLSDQDFAVEDGGVLNQSGDAVIHLALSLSATPTKTVKFKDNGGGAASGTQSGNAIIRCKDFKIETSNCSFTQMGDGLIDLNHDWKNLGTFFSLGGTVQFSGEGGGGPDYVSGTNQFFNILIDDGANPKFDLDANTTIKVAGNWTNNSSLTRLTDKSTTVEFNGSSAQTIGGSVVTTFNNLTVSNFSGDVNLDSDATVENLLLFTFGKINTGSKTLTLGTTSGTLLGENAGKYVVGNLTTTKPVGTGTSTLGNIGVTISAGPDNIGNVTVTRVSGPAGIITANQNSGIARNWTITSTNPPSNGRDITLSWVVDDDNDVDLAFGKVFISSPGDTNWFPTGDSENVSSTRTITCEGATEFIEYTVGDENFPLPVELASFAATVNDYSVNLIWQTDSEINNLGFEIQRMTDQDWERIAFVEGHGTTTERNNYSFTDDNLSAGKYSYRLKQVDFNGAYQYSNTVNTEIAKPLNFKLSQNHPNPFNPSTSINFQIQETGLVTLIVYDILGNEIAALVNEKMEPGSYDITYDASNLSSGTYIYQLRMGSFVETKKLILIK